MAVEDIFHETDMNFEQQAIKKEMIGENPVYFLPYLMGERSPINDASARAAFVGMSMDTRRSDLVLAVLEGVAFGIRDSLEAAKKMGIEIKRSNLCGGGAKSLLWRKILAAVLNIKLDILQTEQGPGLGAAILAMVADGIYDNLEIACEKIVRVIETIEPDEELAAKYQKRYEIFQLLYPALKDIFPKLY